jgi:small-conductance mechanosensitive channel
MHNVRRLTATLLCVSVVTGCGWLGFGDAESGSEGAVSEEALAVDSVGLMARAGADSVRPLVPDSTAPGAEEGVLGDTSTATSGSLPSDAAAQAGAASPLENRIDVLIAAQAETQRRLDSLTALVRPAPIGDGDAVAGSAGEAMGTAAGGSVGRSERGTNGAAGGQPAEVLEEAGSQVRSFGVGVLWSIVVVFLFNLLIHAVAWVLDQLSERSARRRLFFKGLVPIVRIVLWLFAAYLIVRVIFRVDAQGIVAGAAALGVAIGFAAQDLLKNLFGGIILVFDQPFQVGDKIRVGETYGEVTSIGLRSTRIVTPDDNRVSVPNAQVVDQQVANANAGELNCQVVIDLYLPADADEVVAKRIAFESAVDSKYVYLNKPIVVLVQEELQWRVFTRIRVKAYVLDPRHEFLFASDVTERARAGFREAGLIGGGKAAALGDDPSPPSSPASSESTGGRP